MGISFDLVPKPAADSLTRNTRRAADAAVKAGAVTPELAGKLTDHWVTNAELKEAEAQLSQPQTPALAAATTALDEAQTSLRLAIANATRLEATGGKDLGTLAELQAAKKSLRAAGEKLGPAIDALVAATKADPAKKELMRKLLDAAR